MCEFGCGSGIISLQLAQAFPNLLVVGIGSEPNTIELAKKNAQKLSLTNCSFHVVDICNLPSEWEGKFDYIFTFDVLHDLHSVKKGLENARKALKEGSYLSAIEPALDKNLQENMNKPWAPFIYSFGLLHCVPTCLYSGDTEEGAFGPGWGLEIPLKCATDAGFKEARIVQEIDFKFHILKVEVGVVCSQLTIRLWLWTECVCQFAVRLCGGSSTLDPQCSISSSTALTNLPYLYNYP